MRIFAVSFIAIGVLRAAAQNNLCLGDWSTCSDGSCALTVDQCGSCPKGQYVCPLSTSCSADGSFASCPGLKGTHFDQSLTVEERLDYIFAQNLTVAELIQQMTDNTTAIPRLSIPSLVMLNDDQHGVKQPDATAFPNGCSMGATWNETLLTQVCG
jgi:beta-glucosidase